MGKIFHTKLNIKSNKIKEAFKSMAGIYRKMFNVGMDIQFYRMSYAFEPEDQLISSTLVHKVVKVGEKEQYPYISKVDCGITKRAVNNSNHSFKRWYHLRETHLPVYMARKDGMKFSTTSKVKVFYDHINLPKVGDVKLYEKGYIPQGKTYKNTTFSYDGKNWWISLEVCDESETTQKPVNESFDTETIKVTSDMKGNVSVGDTVFLNVVENGNYKVQKAKRASLMKKLRRQKEANTEYPYGKKTIRTSRNMMKTRARIKAISSKMKEIKKDYFRKVACEVARTKPRELQMLSLADVRRNHQSYLTRYLRESGTSELLNMIKRKAESIGSIITRYSESTS